MNAVLVTGGAGYIGSHVCKALAAAGYLPVCYDDLSSGHRWAVRWGPLEVGDIADGSRLDAVLSQYRPVAAMHFAGLIFVGESVTDPARYYHTNVAGSLGLLAALRRHGIDRLVFSSTAAVYGQPDRDRIDETTPLAPINPYGRSKLMIEQVLADYRRAYGVRSTALRYFNACGADPDGDIGEAHDPETHLIPRALMALAGAIPHLDVYGQDYPTTDGTAVRDYIHVADLAQAHVLALRQLEAGSDGGAFNLGIGRGFSVAEIIAAVTRVTGRQPPLRQSARRAGDPATLVADAARARAELGFAPVHTDLDAVVATAWQWYSRHAAAAV